MNAFLLGEWRDRVQAGHTIICLGDVLHEDVWRNESLMNEIRSCPGDRVLVLGNHDGNARGLRLLGFTVQHTLALCVDRPPAGPEPRAAASGPARRDLRARPPARGNRADRAAHQPDRRADPVPAGTARPGRRAGPRARVDHQQQPTMKRSRVVAAGAERATEMRVGWKETIALSPGCARSRLPWSRPVQGLGRPRDFLVAGGLDVSLAECLFEPIAARRQQCRVGLRFPVYLAYFFEVLGLQSVDPSLDVLDVLRSGTGPAGPKEPGREGRGTARRGEGQDFDCCGRRHGMAISTMFRRARVLGPGTVLPSSSRRARRLTSLSLTGR